MNVRQRVLTAKLIEESQNDPDYLKELGVEILKTVKPRGTSPPKKKKKIENSHKKLL